MRVVTSRARRGRTSRTCATLSRCWATCDNLIEVLGRLADPAVAHAAFTAAVEKHATKRIFLREKTRVIRRYEPRE